jgi:hypothetical protein
VAVEKPSQRACKQSDHNIIILGFEYAPHTEVGAMAIAHIVGMCSQNLQMYVRISIGVVKALLALNAAFSEGTQTRRIGVAASAGPRDLLHSCAGKISRGFQQGRKKV